MALVGVVYSVGQARVRRIYVPDNDAVLQSGLAGPGEALLTYDRKLGHSVSVAQSQVSLATGKSPSDDTCAVVDKNGLVLCMIKADPALDNHPDGTIVQAFDKVGIGCSYNAQLKTFTTPITKVPAGTKKIDGSLTLVDIPGGGEVLSSSTLVVSSL